MDGTQSGTAISDIWESKVEKDQSSSSEYKLSCHSGELPKSVSQLLVEWPFLAKNGVAPSISASTDHLIEFWGWVTEMRWCNDTSGEYPVCEPGIGFEVSGLPCLCPPYDYRGVEITSDNSVVFAQKTDNVVVCVSFTSKS